MPAADVWAFGIIAWEAVEQKEDIAGIAYQECLNGLPFGLLEIIYGVLYGFLWFRVQRFKNLGFRD